MEASPKDIHVDDDDGDGSSAAARRRFSDAEAGAGATGSHGYDMKGVDPAAGKAGAEPRDVAMPLPDDGAADSDGYGARAPQTRGRRSSSILEMKSTDVAPADRIFVQFHFGTCLTVFFLHLFFPLSCFAAPFLYGWDGARKMQLVPAMHLQLLYHNWLMPLGVVVLNLFVQFHPGYSSEKGGPLGSEIVALNAYYIIRAAMIGIKYGWMSDSEVKWYLTMAPPEQAREFAAEYQLLTGWMKPSVASLHREIDDSARRQRIPVSRDRLPLVSSERARRRVQDLTRDTDTDGGDKCGLPAYSRGDTEVSSTLLGVAMVRAASTGDDSLGSNAGVSVLFYVRTLGRLLAVFHAAQPVFTHLEIGDGSLAHVDPLNAVLTLVSIFCRQYYWWLLYAYMVVAVYDYHRRYVVIHKMTKLMIPWVRKKHESSILEGSLKTLEWDNPVLDVSIPEVALKWTRLRLVMQEFGLRFHYRLQAFATLGAALMVINVINTFALALGGGTAALTETEAFLLLQMTMFNVVVLFTLIILMIVFGDWGNEETAIQQDEFVRKELELTTKLEALDPDLDAAERKAALHSRDVMRHVRKRLKRMDRVNPIMMLQMRADRTLLQGIALGVGSISAVGARLLAGGS